MQVKTSPLRRAVLCRRIHLVRSKLAIILTCGCPCRYSCYEDVCHPLESILSGVGILAGLADKQHEDAELQQQCKGTERVQVLQTGLAITTNPET